jgi:hypothetical protein
MYLRLQVVLYLNQMAVFNFVDDNSTPGCALLKLSDGRKRSMSLWVEFITASGYLSARKIRARFHTLVQQACEKCFNKEKIKFLLNETNVNTEVKLRINDMYTVHIVPAFKCNTIWPRSATDWPSNEHWPCENLVNEVKQEGFHLLSKESQISKEKQQQQQQQQHQQQQSSSESDAWIISFTYAENKLIRTGGRHKCLSILKSLVDRHLQLPGNPINNHVIKTLVLYECEKHPFEYDWEERSLCDRLNGIILQLISCLQSRSFPSYFLPYVDMFRGKDARVLDIAAKTAWRLQRELLFNAKCWESL